MEFIIQATTLWVVVVCGMPAPPHSVFVYQSPFILSHFLA